MKPVTIFDEFTQGYVEALFFWAPETEDVAGRELGDGASALIYAQCAEFQDKNADLLERYYHACGESEYTPQARAGHDFYLTRNGHGAGFWDRGFGKIGERLADAARGYGPHDLYVGDDGNLYAM